MADVSDAGRCRCREYQLLVDNTDENAVDVVAWRQ